MADRPSAWARTTLRTTGRSLLGRSYTLTKRVALLRIARRASPTVVFSMGKTGSTAIARAVEEATGKPVFQVFRLDPKRLGEAEQRYRARNRARTTDGPQPNPFPGAYHLWESEYLVGHPPTPDSPWTVITTVREPLAQAVSAFFHAARQSGSLTGPDASVDALAERFVAEKWVRPPLQWFDREFEPAVGVDAFAHPFEPSAGYSTVETPAVRLLVLRQESFACAPSALAAFLKLGAPVVVARRNDGAVGPNAAIYRRFIDEVRLPRDVVDEAYDSRYARHFYGMDEIAQFHRQWSKA